MDPIVIGRVTDPDKLALNPVDVTLVGYTLEREEVAETFRFRPVVPTGAALEVMRHTDANGNIPLGRVLDYVDACVLEADQEPLNVFLSRNDVMIEPDAMVEMYRALVEYYSARPTPSQSASRSTPPAAKRTSRAAARSAGSRSKSSRSSSG